MGFIEQLDLPLWDILKEATIAPDEADLRQLLDTLEQALANLNTIEQLQVAAEAIAQITQVYRDRSILAFEELEATATEEGPVMPEDAFDRYVRQTMAVDLDQFIELLESLPRKPRERSPSEESGSVVAEIDQTTLLQALDEQISQHPGLTDIEAFNQAMGIAHDEDVSTWVSTIAQHLETGQTSTLSLVQLQRSVGMPLVQLWLALLLGGFALEQRGDFYQTEQIWVSPI